MQTINLDLSTKNIVPLLHAKQGDVGRKFTAVITDAGEPCDLADAAFSVWYTGTSGEGNYTDIGDNSAFSVDGNTVTVELITQMLTNTGSGVLCLVMSTAEGGQLGTWNIPYHVEGVPGSESEEAQQYYTAFQRAVADLPYPDASLSVAGKAADAAAVGAALGGKAPAGYGLGGSAVKPPNNSLNEAVLCGWYVCSPEYTGAPTGHQNIGYGMVFVSSRGSAITQEYFSEPSTNIPGSPLKLVRERYANGTWTEWEWVNPPMTTGVEYRTTERWNGKAVYTTLVDCGSFPSSSTKTVAHGLSISQIVRCVGTNSDYFGIVLPYTDPGSDTLVAGVSAHHTSIFVKCAVSSWTSYRCLVQLWYTKN